MQTMELNEHEYGLFAEAVKVAMNAYQARAQEATRGSVPAFGMDDQPPASPGQKVDPLAAHSLVFISMALLDMQRTMRKGEIETDGNPHGTVQPMSWRSASDDEEDLDRIVTLYCGGGETPGFALRSAIFTANAQQKAPRETMALLERIIDA